MGDSEKATHVLVYFHGGGFVMPGVPVRSSFSILSQRLPFWPTTDTYLAQQHLDLCHSMIKWCDGNLAIFCPAYTLTPGAPYPTQIGECVEALRYILSQPGRSPSNIIIGGDSAGGNLVLAILSHISGHPHSNSSLVKPLELDGKLCGALAISPWTSSDEDKFASVSQFAERDCITATCANYWKDLYKGGLANPTGQSVPDDQYIVPEIAEPQWWKGAKVESMLVTVGEEEVLRDAILSWAEKFKEGVGEGVLKVVRGKKEAHDGPLNPKTEAELNAEGAEERCSNAAIKGWLRDLV